MKECIAAARWPMRPTLRFCSCSVQWLRFLGRAAAVTSKSGSSCSSLPNPALYHWLVQSYHEQLQHVGAHLPALLIRLSKDCQPAVVSQAVCVRDGVWRKQ
jgi:hypothetical protein